MRLLQRLGEPALRGPDPVGFGGPGGEKSPGVGDRLSRIGAPGEHPCQLLDPPLAAQPLDPDAGPLAVVFLDDAVVAGGLRGDGGEVGDAEHLVVGRHPEGDWRLVVRVNEQEVFASPIDKTTAPELWKVVVVDLTAYAGQEVRLQLCHCAYNEFRNEQAYWEAIKILPHE